MTPRATTLLGALTAAVLLPGPTGALPAQSCPSDDADTTAISGSVRDTEGRMPLVGARVSGRWRAADGDEQVAEVWTDADGRYALCRPPPRTRVRLRARVGSEPGPERTVRTGPDGRRSGVQLRAPLEEPEASSGLIGRIFEDQSRQPVEGARVRLEGRDGPPVTTNREGSFAFQDLPGGTYVLHVEHLAYEPFADTVHLAPGRPLQMGIPVATDPIPLEGIEVTVRSRAWVRRRAEFYDRMERGHGHFITRSEIVERGEPPVSSLLRTVPGVRLERTPGGVGPGYFPVIRNCGVPVVYVDNARLGRLFPGIGIDEFISSNVEAIEIHSGPATVPIRSNRDAACGVIQIWTRDPG